MKMEFTAEEQAFINTYNAKVLLWETLKSFFESNLLTDEGTKFKSTLEIYLSTNMDKWVELQIANNN